MAQTESKKVGAEERLHWFTQDRLGLFIHWGLYALPARHEWVKNRERLTDEHYQRYFEHFDPDLYDPVVWARLAKQAGMRYAVLTTKHHEGFCLWDSQLTDYKAPNTPAGRDLLRPWVDAFRAEGLKIGFYHSLIDWHHPEFTVDMVHPQRDDLEYREAAKNRDIRKYAEYLRGQVRELLTNYGKIDIFWPDFSYTNLSVGWAHGKGRADWQSEELVAMIRELQPEILINNRLDYEEEADFFTPEQVQPRGWVQVKGKRVPWEACQTLNGSWGYDRDNMNWKSSDLLVRMLVDTVSKGGNLLLNVGPTARGEFDPRAQDTLARIGEWMRRHGRAIYGATESEFAAPTDCRLTQQGNRLYLHVFSWPMGTLSLDGLADRVEYAQLLHDGSEIHFRNSQGKDGYSTTNTLELSLPILRPDVEVPVIELFLK
jgi:alpha-L-fucosidase